tara:strand:- start:1389 stop:2015 length:627 start_codon:yes stop_codon:yes gene_type:complete
MAEYNSNIRDIFKSRKILMSHLKNVNYNVSAFENSSYDEIYYMSQHKELNFQAIDDKNNTVFVKYFLDKPVKSQLLQNITEELFNTAFVPTSSTIVIIIKDEPNSTLQELVKQIYAEEDIYIILYNIKRLLFNIREHSFVPNHKVLTNEQAEVFKKKFFIESEKQLPTISRFDPVANAILLKPGQICKINRNSVNSIHSEYYRVCVNI